MAKAKIGDTVNVHYTGRLGDGTVFDSSHERGEPLMFTLGGGQVIPGFNDAVVGMEPGETKTVTIPSDQAYGPREQGNLFQVDRSEFPPGISLETGQLLQKREPSGETILFTVVEVTDSAVTLDANHPLAGQDLTFDLQLVQIIS